MSEKPPSTVLPPTELDADTVLASQLRFGAYDNTGPYKLAVGIDPVGNPGAFLDEAINAMGSYQSLERPDRHEEEADIRGGESFYIGRNATGEPGATEMGVYSKERVTMILEAAVGSVALRSYMKGMDELSKPVSTPAPEETRPRQALSTEAHLVEATPNVIVTAEGVTAYEVAESTPEALAIAPSTTELTPSNEASLVEPPKNVDESVVDGRIHEGSSNDVERKNDIALREVANKYGFEEGDSAEYVITELESALSGLDDMLDFHSKSVKQELTEAIHSIKRTLQHGGIVYFAGRKREPTREILFGEKSFRRKVAEMDITHLSKASKSCIEGLNRQLIQAGSAFDDATRKGSDFIVHEPADMLSKLLGRINDVDPLSREATALRQDINDLRIMQGMPELEVSAKTGKDAESLDGEVEFRNEQVKAWAAIATELKYVGVEDPRVEKLVDNIRVSVAIESGMDGDPSSPGIWFGSRVRDDDNKSRAIPRAGHYHASSQRYVAELAADMLRGRFDTESFKRDRIKLNPKAVGGVELGQHRAAALAMIYGPEWINKAESMGALE